MKILRYNNAWRSNWDKLVDQSAQGTFLHKRGYLEYHADRFVDYSLIAIDDKDRLVAALPASLDSEGRVVKSHGGLTYGGWITDPKRVNANVMLELFGLSLDLMKEDGIAKLIYRPVPTIYHRYPAEDDMYALFRNGATVDAVNISTAIDLAHPLSFDQNARRCVKFAQQSGVIIDNDSQLDRYWEMLSALLQDKYHTRPVHSLDEMRLLVNRFPDNIKLHTVSASSGEIVAGVLIYLTPTVAHCQYIATTNKGRDLKALPLLFKHLIQVYTPLVRYFDFGTSNEDSGRYLNAGLLRQKAGMGGRGIAYTSWAIDLSNLYEHTT